MKRKNIKIIFLLTIFFSLANFVKAAPSVSEVSGTILHDANITVNGSGFGIKPYAQPELWDRVDNVSAYSALTNGMTVLVDGPGRPWTRNGYFAYTVDNMKFSTAQQRNANSLENYFATEEGSFEYHPIEHETGAIYLSWWFRFQGAMPDDYKLLRLSDSSDEQNKTFSLASRGGYVFLSNNPECYNNTYTWTWSKASPDTWTRYEVLLDGSNRFYKVWINGSQSGDTMTWPETCPAVSFDSVWRIGFDEASGTFWMDDVYLDTTPARVEICTGSEWAARGHCEIQSATSWNASAISLTVNQGSFTDSSSAFLYVSDSAGTVNADGFPIIFGVEAGDTLPPSAPSSLSVM